MISIFDAFDSPEPLCIRTTKGQLSIGTTDYSDFAKHERGSKSLSSGFTAELLYMLGAVEFSVKFAVKFAVKSAINPLHTNPLVLEAALTIGCTY